MCNPSRALVLELRHEDEFNHDGSVDVAVTNSVGATCSLYKELNYLNSWIGRNLEPELQRTAKARFC